jgi:hypothetical protein
LTSTQKESIPYANILINKSESMISNEGAILHHRKLKTTPRSPYFTYLGNINQISS